MIPMTPAVAFEGVDLSLGGRQVLHDVSFAIQPGEFVGVLGPNGGGKTTLMRAILGLVSPSAGRISVGGAPAARGSGRVGYLPQLQPAVSHLAISGRDFVASAFGGERWGLPWPSAERSGAVDQALAAVDGAALARRQIGSLSGGERHRLLLAQALLGKPALLLLDEPLSSLDILRQTEAIALIRRLQRERGLTVLFSAHDINPLLGAIDRVLYLGGGSAAIGPVDQVIAEPVLSRLYGTEIEVLRLKGRIFVMAGSHHVEGDRHHHHAAL